MKNYLRFNGILSVSFITVLAMLMIITACSKGSVNTESGTGDLEGFELKNIPGTTVQHAVKINENSVLLAEGYADAGKRQGQWVEYNPEGEILLMENFIDGLREGLSLKFASRGQIEIKARYHQGALDGPWTQYKFGKIIEERNYKMNMLDGPVKMYDDRTWNLKKEVQYKDGKQDGYFRYYDAEGNVTLEYMYKNGEKVSGGIVEKKDTSG